MVFSDEDEKKLINIVAKHPVIFDTTHANYRNNAAKDIVWQTIADELNKDCDDCKKKWKFIRDGYNRFRKKHHAGSSLAAPKHSKDKRHKLLSFLDGIPKLNRSSSWLPSSPEVLEKIVDGDPGFSSEEQEKPVYAVAWTDTNTDYKPTEAAQAPELQETKEVKANSKNSRRKIVSKRLVKKKSDDVSLFCRHLAKVLRKLPPVEKAKAKKHLNSVLSDYEIMAAKNSSERQHYYSSSSTSTTL